MRDAPLPLFLLLLFLAFIFPIGIYCLILGALNRWDRPVLVSGPWDFAGVLFAASGVLLVVVPFGILRSLHERWSYNWVLGPAGQCEGMASATYYFWLALWFLYYAGVILCAAWMLKRRRGITAVYNVDYAVLEVGLSRVLERLGLGWRRTGNYFLLNPAASNGLALELESFPPLRHATLRWHGVDDAFRQAIEKELETVLAGMPTTENSVGGWFLSLGASVMLVTLAGVAFMVFVNWRRIRG
jgi:hypothetical protein